MASPIKLQPFEHLGLLPWQQKPKAWDGLGVQGFPELLQSTADVPLSKESNPQMLRTVQGHVFTETRWWNVHVSCVHRWATTHHSDAVPNGLGRQVAAELGPDHPAVAVGTGHLPPDHSGLVGFASRSHRVPATAKTNSQLLGMLGNRVHTTSNTHQRKT